MNLQNNTIYVHLMSMHKDSIYFSELYIYIYLICNSYTRSYTRYIRVGEYGGNKNRDGFGEKDNNK